jgi:hypothetical protein
MPAELLSASAFCEHIRNSNQKPITIRTLDRWVERGVVPAPLKINGRNYYRSECLDQLIATRKSEVAR